MFHIPLAEMIEDVAMMVGVNIGVAVKVDADDKGRCTGLFMRGE